MSKKVSGEDGLERVRGMLVAPPDVTTLAAAEEWLRANAHEGAMCPACAQTVKVYKRRINSMMAYALLLIYRHFERDAADWLHVSTFLLQQGLSAKVAAAIRGDYAKLKHFGLLEAKEDLGLERRRDGNPRVGLYRITELGRRFVRGEVRVRRYIYQYNKQTVEVECAETVSIYEALGKRFNYREIMRPGWDEAEAEAACVALPLAS